MWGGLGLWSSISDDDALPFSLDVTPTIARPAFEAGDVCNAGELDYCPCIEEGYAEGDHGIEQ